MPRKLPKIVKKGNKRVGRGYGSGKGGHTAGRGMKGQKSRSSIGILFEGLKMKKSFIKRLPFQRGKGKFKAKTKPLIVNIEELNDLRSGSRVDIKTLIDSDIVKRSEAKKSGVKILGKGKLTKKLTVELPVSVSAFEKIKKAGGKVVEKNLIRKR